MTKDLVRVLRSRYREAEVERKQAEKDWNAVRDASSEYHHLKRTHTASEVALSRHLSAWHKLSLNQRRALQDEIFD